MEGCTNVFRFEFLFHRHCTCATALGVSLECRFGLEEGDTGYAGGSGLEAKRGVFGGDSAQGEDGDGYGRGGGLKGLEA